MLHLYRKLLSNYFSIYGTTNVQKDSYEDFIYKRIQEIIDEEKNIEIMINKKEKYIITFGDVTVDSPYIIEED